MEVVASPLIVTGPDQATLEKRISDVRARIAFYASTRTYRPVFDLHEWGDIGQRLSELSRSQQWDELERHVTDDMVETVAVVGTYDDIAHKVKERYAGVCSGVEFSIPVENPEDEDLLAEMVRIIQSA
ncbi:hypothetical protein BH23ACT5_BH23ACT5_01170 [soil metagenome]